MKHFFFLLAGLSFIFNLAAQNSDLISKKDFQAEKKKIYDNIGATKKIAQDAKKLTGRNDKNIDSLKNIIMTQGTVIVAQKDSLSTLRSQFNALKERIDSKKTLSRGVKIVGVLAVILLILILYGLWYFWKRKSDADVQRLESDEKAIGEKADTGIRKVDSDLQAFTHKTDFTIKALDEKELKDVETVSQSGMVLEAKVKDLSDSTENRMKKIADEHQLVRKDLEMKIAALQSEAAKRSEETRTIARADNAKLVEKIDKEIAGLKQLLSPLKDQMARLSKDIEEHKQSHLKKG